MEVELDESAWPVVVVRWKDSALDLDLGPLLAKMDEWLARGPRFGLLLDLRGSVSLSPEQRAKLLAHMRANARLTARRLVQATVIDSLVSRTLFYGVNLLVNNPFPSQVFAEPEAARRWLVSMLEAPPPGTGAG